MRLYVCVCVWEVEDCVFPLVSVVYVDEDIKFKFALCHLHFIFSKLKFIGGQMTYLLNSNTLKLERRNNN